MTVNCPVCGTETRRSVLVANLCYVEHKREDFPAVSEYDRDRFINMVTDLTFLYCPNRKCEGWWWPATSFGDPCLPPIKIDTDE